MTEKKKFSFHSRVSVYFLWTNWTHWWSSLWKKQWNLIGQPYLEHGEFPCLLIGQLLCGDRNEISLVSLTWTNVLASSLVSFSVEITEYISIQEMKQGQCICPLSWSVHCNFTGDGKCNERGWACTPHPHQPSLILPSWLNVRQKAEVTTLCTLWWRSQWVLVYQSHLEYGECPWLLIGQLLRGDRNEISLVSLTWNMASVLASSLVSFSEGRAASSHM